jgi:hypothetical protein
VTGFFSLRYRVETGSGAHPVSCPVGVGGSYPGGEADHSPTSSAKVKKEWSCISTPPIRLLRAVLN